MDEQSALARMAAIGPYVVESESATERIYFWPAPPILQFGFGKIDLRITIASTPNLMPDAEVFRLWELFLAKREANTPIFRKATIEAYRATLWPEKPPLGVVASD